LYFRWEYLETYEYHARYDAFYFCKNDQVIPRLPSEHTFVCWKNRSSTELLLASSAGLSSDLIFEQPLIFIPRATQPLSVKYSLEVKQTALPKAAYDYLQNLRKNTELTGSIFDPQPSQTSGNIRSLDDPSEPVLGYIYASTVQKQRIFISNDDLAPWGYQITGCHAFPSGSFGCPYVPLYQTVGGFLWTDPECADCTFDGGTLEKPDYWP
jgi:hypothetical protein